MSEKVFLGIINTESGWKDLVVEEKQKQEENENKVVLKSISEFIEEENKDGQK